VSTRCFLYGTGANGKGTFLNTLFRILGNYATAAPMETFTASGIDRHPTELAGLRGARLVTAQETEEGRAWSEAKIKALTGGDPIPARFMRQDYFTFTPEFKLFIAGNHKPGLRNVDESIRRRLHLVPFTVTIPEEERDPELADKLIPEWPGILAWAIEGFLLWQRFGLRAPSSVTTATSEYLEAEDTLGAWIRERYKPISYGCTEVGVMYQDWKGWAIVAGEEPGSMKRFSQALEAKGYEKCRAGNDRKAFKGIALNDVFPARTEPAHERD
jgi:putative DNA primase/helicase